MLLAHFMDTLRDGVKQYAASDILGIALSKSYPYNMNSRYPVYCSAPCLDTLLQRQPSYAIIVQSHFAVTNPLRINKPFVLVRIRDSAGSRN